MSEFKEKCVVVTGGGAGLGRAIALAFARAGANVVVSGRTLSRLENVLREIEAAGGRGLAVQADVGRREDAVKTIDAAVAAFGRLDALINNAHDTSITGPLETLSEADLRRSLDSGLGGTLFHMQAALPHLKATKGAIVNFGSRQGTHGAEGYGAYAAAKEGIRALSRVAAREFGPSGVRVNVVNPAAETEEATAFFKANPGSRDYFAGQAALRRIGDPHTDIAPTVLFLCSQAAVYMTGQTINLDGGQVMF